MPTPCYQLLPEHALWMLELRAFVRGAFPGNGYPTEDDEFAEYWADYFDAGCRPEEAFRQEKACNRYLT